MYLTKIDLIPQQRGIRQALGDCQQLHQMIMGLFESDRKSSGVIYRVREDRYALAIYLYSNRPVLSLIHISSALDGSFAMKIRPGRLILLPHGSMC